MDAFLEFVQGVFNWLKGRKTIVTIVLLGGLASLESMGYLSLPVWIYLILGTLAVVFLKMGVNRIEAQAGRKK